MDAALVSGGLEFLAIGVNTFDSGSTVTTEVRVGKAPTNGAAFVPLIDVTGGLSVDTTANTTTTTLSSSSVKVFSSTDQATAQALFSGTHTFTQANATLSSSDGGASSVSVLGDVMAISALSLADNATIQASGSFTITSGVSVALPSGVTIPIAASGPTVPSFSVSVGGGAKPSVAGLNLTLGGSGTNMVTAGYDSTLAAFYISGTASAGLGSAGTFSVTLGDATHRGVTFDASGISSVFATVSTTASLTLGGLTVTPNALSLSYTKGGNTSFAGGLNFALPGSNTLNLALTGKGAVIDSSGNLSSLDATVKSTINEAGASLALNGAVSFSAPNTFSIYGGATATFPKIGTVTVTLGTSATNAGIVVSSGDVTAINAKVTSTDTLSLGGLSVTEDPNNPVSFSYTKGGNTSFAGGLDFSIPGGSQLDVALNGTGVVLDSRGKLLSISASVSGDIGVAGKFVISPKNLTFSYDASSQTYLVYGGVAVTLASTSVKSVTATLGTSATDPGLKIVNGMLDHLNIGLSGSFELFGIMVTPTNLQVIYSAGDPTHDTTISLSGSLAVNFTSTVSVSASIGVSPTDPSMTTNPLVLDLHKDGTVGVDLSHGFGVAVAGSFKGFSLTAMVAFAPGSGSTYNVSASGSLKTPGGIGFDAVLHIHDNKLADLTISVSAKVPVGDTGLYITWVLGSLTNLDTNDPTITAAATLIYVDAHILTITGAIEVNKEHLLLSADKTNLPKIFTDGTVKVADHQLGVFVLDGAIGQFGGSVDLNWAAGVYRVHAYGNLLDGLATMDVGITLTNAGNLSFSADVGIGIPDSIPLIGGLRLATGHVRMEYRNGDLHRSYVAAWGDFFDGLVTAGIEFHLDDLSHPVFLDASAIASLASGNSPTHYTVGGQPAALYQGTVTGYTTGSLQLVVSDPFFDQNYVNPSNSGSTSSDYILRHTNIELQLADGSYINNEDLSYTTDPVTGQANANNPDYPVAAVDTVNPNSTYSHTARIITINPKQGQAYLQPGVYKIFLINNIGNGDRSIIDAATAKASPQPLAPDFKTGIPLLASSDGSPSNDASLRQVVAPVATRLDLDTIHVSARVSSYNPNSPITVSVYATTTPLPAGADPSNPLPVLDANGHPVLGVDGKPKLAAATLISKHVEPYAPNMGDFGVIIKSIYTPVGTYARFTYAIDVQASSLPTPPDGNTPVYFYFVVDDGLNHPTFSPASNPKTLLSVLPVVTAPAALQTDFKSIIGFSSVVVSNATSVTIKAGDGRVLFPLIAGQDSPAALAAAQSAGLVHYVPSASGASAGTDTVTITAYNKFTKELNPFITTRVIRLLPPNNVDLSIQLDDFNADAGMLSTTRNNSTSQASRPITEGETVDLNLEIDANPTPIGGASTAQGVIVRFPIPAGMTYVSSTTFGAQGSYDPGTGIWTVTPSLKVGSKAFLLIHAKVNAGTAGTVIMTSAIIVPDKSNVDINPASLTATTSFVVASPISGRVVLATNSASSTDPLNLPAAGITVYQILANTAGNVEYRVGSAVTDADGRYNFPVRPSADYPVVHIRIYGINDTSQVSDDYMPGKAPTFHTTAVKPSTISGVIDHRRFPDFYGNTVTSLSVDFTAKSGGLAYLDLNNDGVWQPTEPSSSTDVNGSFLFKNVVPGNYVVRELLKPGRVASDALGNPGPDSQAVRVTAGNSDDNTTLRYTDQITFQGHGFLDTNKNNVFDDGEPGQANFIYDLDRYQGAITNFYQSTNWYYGFQTSISDSAGKYHFDNLAPGMYRIRQRVIGDTRGTLTPTVVAAGVGANGFIQVFGNGDVVLFGLYQDPTSGSQYFDYVKDTQANHLSHIDFGNTLTPFLPGLTAHALALGAPTAPSDSLRFTIPSTVQAGEVSQVTVTAIKPDGSIDYDFVGTINLSSDDDAALLASSYTFLPSDSGSHTFGLSLMTVAQSTVSATIADGPQTAFVSDPIDVHSGHATDCVVTASAAITPGKSYKLKLNPVDHVGNTDPNYWGNAQIVTSLAVNGVVVDPSTLPAAAQAWLAARAGLPSTYHFGLFDGGNHTFNVVAPALDAATIAAIPGMGGSKPGKLSLVVNVTDPTNQISAASVSIPVASSAPIITPTPLPTPTFAVTVQGSASAIVGLPSTFTVVATGLSGIGRIDAPHQVRFTSSDPAATLPAVTTFAPGASHADVVFRFATPGVQTITAIDAATGAVLGSSTVEVHARQATPTASTIDAIYQTLLGHPADSTALAKFVDHHTGGVAIGRLVTSLTQRVDYAQAQANQVYRHLLGRAPSASEQALAVAMFHKSGSVVTIQMFLMGGREYYALQGGTNATFLAALGRDALGRDLTAAEHVKLTSRLVHGASHASVAIILLNSPAGRRARAVSLFESLLGRNPSELEASRLTATLNSHGGLVKAITQLVSSAEFRTIATGQILVPSVAVTLPTTPAHRISSKAASVLTVGRALPIARVASRLQGVHSR